MAKQIEYLIGEIRKESDNEDFDATVGLTEEEIVKYINEAEDRLHSKISAVNKEIFTLEYEDTVVADQESYNIDHRAHLKNAIISMEYSHDSDVDNYYPLRPASRYNRRTGAKGDPARYIRSGGKYYLLPTPDQTGGKVRVTIKTKRRRLDKRRGLVKAVTLDSGTSTITNLEINYVNDTTIDSTELSKRTHYTVVDKYGDIKMRNIKLSSIDSSVSYNATLTSDSSHTYASGESIAVGDYVVSGDYCSSHSEFDEQVERYIQAYAVYKCLKKDSSVDSAEALQELAQLEQDIIEAYRDVEDDIVEISEINDSFDWGDWV